MKLKIELKQKALKELILDYYLKDTADVWYDSYTSDFYMDEKGEMVFIVETSENKLQGNGIGSGDQIELW